MRTDERGVSWPIQQEVVWVTHVRLHLLGGEELIVAVW